MEKSEARDAPTSTTCSTTFGGCEVGKPGIAEMEIVKLCGVWIAFKIDAVFCCMVVDSACWFGLFVSLSSSPFFLFPAFFLHSLPSFSVCYGGVKAFLAFILVYDCCLPLLSLFRITESSIFPQNSVWGLRWCLIYDKDMFERCSLHSWQCSSFAPGGDCLPGWPRMLQAGPFQQWLQWLPASTSIPLRNY